MLNMSVSKWASSDTFLPSPAAASGAGQMNVQVVSYAIGASTPGPPTNEGMSPVSEADALIDR